MKTSLDWSAYDSYGAGDAYAHIPSSGGSFGKAAAVCIGNRQCQRDEKGVMCPSYRVTHDEKHSTRHRAATLRAALDGEYGMQPFAGPELAEAMALCVACKGCKRECPNGTDMSALRSETLAQRWQALGRIPLRERLLASVPAWIGHLRSARWLLRLRNGQPWLARLMQRVSGIAARRSLPVVAARSFLAGRPAVLGVEQGREVALFVDTFNNQIEPANAEAALKLLLAGGYRVHLLGAASGQPLCCGRSWYSAGMIGRAREEAARLLAAAAPLARRGVPIIGLEPSCLLMLRDEYHALGLGEEVAVVAKSALLLEEFLAREYDAKRLTLGFRDCTGEQVAVHGHCHQKAFGAMKSVRKVLGLVPGLQVEFVESSCCGMAGGFGYAAEHYEVSMQMGELALFPALRATATDSEIVANGSSCRHQIRDGVARDSRHLACLLAERLTKA